MTKLSDIRPSIIKEGLFYIHISPTKVLTQKGEIYDHGSFKISPMTDPICYFNSFRWANAIIKKEGYILLK